MALEAMIRTAPDRGDKRRGDVIEIRLAPGNWGDRCMKVHQTVPWTDAAIERELQNRRNAGELYPFVTTPYKETVEATLDDGERRRITRTRSRRYFDIDSLPASIKADVIGDDVKVMPDRFTNTQLRNRKTKTTTQINAERDQNREDANRRRR